MPRPVLWERPVSYAAVGATQAIDLLSYPPTGFRPVERRARIGHGDTRFAYACAAAFSWGIQRNSGMRVRPADATRPAGDAIGMLSPGDTVELLVRIGPITFSAPVRVVYVTNEPHRQGFAYGTLPGHPEIGEESFVVDLREDGSVWLTIRAFSRPSRWYWWALYPLLRLVQEVFTRRYLRALAGPLRQELG